MIDRTRTVAERRLGVDAVDPISVFEEGCPMLFGADGWKKSIIATAGIRGIAGASKSSTVTVAVLAEQVHLVGAVLSNLKHATLTPDIWRVTNLAGAPYIDTVDYFINPTNGTINRVGAGIPDPSDVLVTYRYELTSIEKQELGRNIDNQDDETLSSGRVVILQGKIRTYITNFDTSRAYTVSEPLYDRGGLISNNNAGGALAFGNVFAIPTPEDPWLGLEVTL